MGFLKSRVGTRREMGPRNVLIMGLVRSLLSMSFLSVYYTIPRDNFLEFLRQVLLQMHLKLFVIVGFWIKLYFA